MNEPESYDAACLNAATAQGLAPVLNALTVAGIDHTLEQTGGFTMVVTVKAPTGIFGITASDDQDNMFLLGFYPGTSWSDNEGCDEHEDLTTTGVIHVIEETMRP